MPRITPLIVKSVLGVACLATMSRASEGQKPRHVEVSGLPALNFDADEGFGYGVILALYSYDPGSTGYR
jgi:hypothetical protein